MPKGAEGSWDGINQYPHIDMYKTGQNMKNMMQRRGLTVRNLQEYLKLATPQSIYHWFEGRNLPTIDNLYALSALFHVPVDALICGNREENYRFSRMGGSFWLRSYYLSYRALYWK